MTSVYSVYGMVDGFNGMSVTVIFFRGRGRRRAQWDVGDGCMSRGGIDDGSKVVSETGVCRVAELMMGPKWCRRRVYVAWRYGRLIQWDVGDVWMSHGGIDDGSNGMSVTCGCRMAELMMGPMGCREREGMSRGGVDDGSNGISGTCVCRVAGWMMGSKGCLERRDIERGIDVEVESDIGTNRGVGLGMDFPLTCRCD